MANEKTQRDRELRSEREKLIDKARMILVSVDVYFINGQITDMHKATDRLISALVELRDAKPNEERRRHVVDALQHASTGDPLQLGSMVSEKMNILYIQGHIDLDKLVSSVVFVRQPETIEMKEIKS